MVGPSTGSGSSRAESRDDRRSQVAASVVALLTAISLWLSAGTVAVISGDTHRIAALPSTWILIARPSERDREACYRRWYSHERPFDRLRALD